MSLFADYIAEREGKSIIERYEGFATYYFVMDGCYIEDIYVKPECRDKDIASQMADEIKAIALSKGFKKLYGTISPAAHGSTESMKVLLAYGFRVHTAQNNLVVFKKDI